MPRHLTSIAILFYLCPNIFAQGTNAEDRPNVVVILTDDQGWGDLSLHGNPNLSTPNIDSLARTGAEVEHFYVCAVCSPTRAEFLTGRYHTRSGVFSTSSGGERFNADEQTIGDVFKRGGYATAAYGKWHSGMQYPYHPNARGFDDYYGFCSGHWGNYFSPMLEHNGQIVQGDGFLVDDLTSRAMDFIDKHQDEPFFVYLPLNTPHSPMQVPDAQWEKFADSNPIPDPDPQNARKQDLQHTRAALAMCENIDMNVGRLLKHLDQKELTDNTIIVYFCDNGPNGSRWNGGLRGRKGSTFEGGLRSPCLIRYPDKIDGGSVVKSIGSAIDLLPTLADLAGIDTSGPKPLDGISLASALTQGKQLDDRLIFSTWNRKASVRNQQYRYHLTGELFDIESDGVEDHDLAASKPEIATAMKQRLEQFLSKTKVKSSRDAEVRPFTLGHPDSKHTQMPARDAIGHGGIKRSNRYPNCTFFHNWASTDDAITWNVDVLEAGLYDVEMYYACDEDDVGSTIELSIGDSSISKKIEVANPSELIGAAEDRFRTRRGLCQELETNAAGNNRTKRRTSTAKITCNRDRGKRGRIDAVANVSQTVSSSAVLNYPLTESVICLML